jgi:hypothetical protein
MPMLVAFVVDPDLDQVLVQDDHVGWMVDLCRSTSDHWNSWT